MWLGVPEQVPIQNSFQRELGPIQRLQELGRSQIQNPAGRELHQQGRTQRTSLEQEPSQSPVQQEPGHCQKPEHPFPTQTRALPVQAGWKIQKHLQQQGRGLGRLKLQLQRQRGQQVLLLLNPVPIQTDFRRQEQNSGVRRIEPPVQPHCLQHHLICYRQN